MIINTTGVIFTSSIIPEPRKIHSAVTGYKPAATKRGLYVARVLKDKGRYTQV